MHVKHVPTITYVSQENFSVVSPTYSVASYFGSVSFHVRILRVIYWHVALGPCV
jgi:hypothetical protein